ncbi:MAG: hypothetical protein MJ157_00485 [Clostridia bacterium]|nr:hypothetical protein [Clostridia bacterium]
MRYYYAELDENQVCKAINDFSEPRNSANLVPLAEFDDSLVGYKYAEGQWQEV